MLLSSASGLNDTDLTDIVHVLISAVLLFMQLHEHCGKSANVWHSLLRS